MNSFNHYAYGAVASWMVSAMAGIRDDPASPGFKRFVLAPVPDARIGSVSAAFVSPYGEIRSAWRYEGDGSWVWTFAVPANSSALVTLPGQSEAREYLPGTYTLTVRR
jgi:alpha-L-rhamnosidase